jgi:hypothetical protein
VHAEACEFFVERAERRVHQRQARVVHRLPGRDRGRVTIEGDQPTLRPQAGEHRPAVTAAPEGAIDINAVATDRERVDRFRKQDADGKGWG